MLLKKAARPHLDFFKNFALHRMPLIKEIKKYYTEHGRSHLPWRQTHDPYKVLVSEVMLQQTQVDRVLPKYEVFIKKFPTATALSKANLHDVLALWSGLGYNRRAKFLHEAAKVVVVKYKGKFPKDVFVLESLPGVGPYTARAIAAFAYNQPVVFIETNIRTVFMYFSILQNNKIENKSFSMKSIKNNSEKISDTELLPLIKYALTRSKMQPRDFYAALMDYGSYLKQSGVRLNSKSKHYTKQPKFKGSARQLRGEIVRQLLVTSLTKQKLISATAHALRIEVNEIENSRIEKEILVLLKENLIEKKAKKFEIKK